MMRCFWRLKRPTGVEIRSLVMLMSGAVAVAGLVDGAGIDRRTIW